MAKSSLDKKFDKIREREESIKELNLSLIQTGLKKFKNYLLLINKFLIIYFGVYFGEFQFGQLMK